MGQNPAGEVGVERLKAALERRLGGRARDLRVLVRGGGLVLQGHTSTYYAKQLAQEVVMEAGGMTVLANEIEVGPVLRPYVDGGA